MAARSDSLLALGRAIRSLREERDLTQEALGLESGVDRTYVGGVERGERNPTYESIARLAAALEVSPSEVLRRAESVGAEGDGSRPGD